MLKLPDGNVLMHGATTYDPIKAREYYLRTRQLKGRKKGSDVATAATSTAPKRTTGSRSVTITVNGSTYKLSPRQHAEQRAYAAMRVAKIQTKLRTLENALREKMAEARKKEREAKKPKSAAEKRKAAQKSEQYRDKHKQALKNKAKRDAAKKSQKPNLDTVDGLKTAIVNARSSLRKAVERQRALTTASKG